MDLYKEMSFALSKGWHVFPLRPRDKLPNGALAPNGVKDASNDPARIRAWAISEPAGNYGIALGPSNLTVLDIDTGLTTVEEAREWLRRNQVPGTFSMRTGRRPSFGLQLYFTGTTPNKPYEHDGCSGEIRSSGYYVVGPNCIHPSGEVYEILADVALAPVPPLVRSLATRRVPRPSGQTVELIEPSFRHYYLIERCRELFYAGLDGQGLTDALVWLYRNRCQRDPVKDARVLEGGEYEQVAQWVREHPPEFPLQPMDFRALRFAEKDPRVQFAYAGDLALFEGTEAEAVQYLTVALKKVGCRDEQIRRILASCPLGALQEANTPDFLKDVNASKDDMPF